MAVLVNSSGKVQMSASGKVRTGSDGESCCCDKYLQAYSCDDDSPVDVWMTTDDAAGFPDAFSISGECYYFNLDDTPGSSPGTVYPASAATAEDDCDSCLNPDICTGCSIDPQPPATVSGMSGGYPSCDPAGNTTYTYTEFVPEICEWIWNFDDGDGKPFIVTAQYLGAGDWYVATGKIDWAFSYGGHVATLSCIDGVIAGTAVIPANVVTGCTGSATVVFG